MITGTDLHAFELCARRVWLKKRNVIWGQENQYIQLGRQNADAHYQKNLKELQLPSIGASGSVVDFINFSQRTVHETKKDSKAKSADILQLLFYLRDLRNLGLQVTKGFIHYPTRKRAVEVEWNESSKHLLEHKLEALSHLLAEEKPPAPIRKPYCRSCSLYEYCFQ